MAQGWLYGRPLPAERIPEMVASAPRTVSSRILSEASEGAMSSLEAMPTHRTAQLRAIYSGAPVGLCFLDRNLRYVSINQRLADLNGAPIAAHIGKPVEEMIPKLFPRVQPFLQRALQGETIANLEVLKPSPKPGEPDLTVLSSYQPAFDEADEVIGVSVALVDVTEHKITEGALREDVEHYRQMVEHSPQIQWVLDADGNLTDISSRWVQLTGMSKEQTSKLGWLEALHPDDEPRTLKALRDALQTGTPINIPHRVKTVDGAWKWLRARAVPSYGPSGEILRWYGGCEDMDEWKEMEEALRKSPECK
jgi:PAS domain S-box-containing protein